MKRILLIAAAVLALGGLSATPTVASDSAADVAWAVYTADNDHGTGRANFAYDVNPGDVVSDEMVVVNTGTTALDLAVYAADAYTTPTGNLDVLAAGVPSVDSGTWIASSLATVHLEPGAQASLPFTVTVPADAAPGDHPAALVTSLSSGAGETVEVDRRLGSRINLRVSGDLAPAVTVTDVSVAYSGGWNPFGAGTATVTYSLNNTGNTRVVANDVVTLAGPLSIAGTTLTGQTSAEIMPGSHIEVVREVSLFGLGWLGGTLTVNPEGVGIGGATLDASVIDLSAAAVPWGLLALVVGLLVIAGVVVLLVVRARRRARAA